MKPKVLFVREKWADGFPELGPSDGNYMIPTLNGMGQSSIYYYDSREITVGWGADKQMERANDLDVDLREVIGEANPDIVMFSHLLSWGERNVKPQTWDYARRLGCKIVGVWHEGAAPDVVRAADEHADCVDLNLFVDTQDQFLAHTKRPEKCLGLLDPRDPQAFRDAGKRRDIPISFVGTLLSRPTRCQGIFSLVASGVPVAVFDRRSGFSVSQERMIDIFQRSAITLNFSDAGPYRHYKGRVAEATLCGAMLLEQDNPEIKRIMREYVDYVPFESDRDLIEKARYYLAHDEERVGIASSGRERARECLDGREFWSHLFSALDGKLGAPHRAATLTA